MIFLLNSQNFRFLPYDCAKHFDFYIHSICFFYCQKIENCFKYFLQFVIHIYKTFGTLVHHHLSVRIMGDRVYTTEDELILNQIFIKLNLT